ncbi:hypothetical protein [Rhodococcus qingshengii]|uniref:hypothetical protein n=1 Tax=Rhodococcus TaxID=1827 RepID=UPI001BA51EBA|nr:hypothetical protein [Rhodococcus qingshengii]MBS3693080.1 hypothetical protein [Rhodococcus qingshengii]
MFTTQVESAYLGLQKQAGKAHDIYEIERIDNALDELVRNPDKSTPAAFQVRSAHSNAAKVIARRRILAPPTSLDETARDLEFTDGGFSRVELETWLEAAPVSAPHRKILRAMLEGAEAPDLAESWGIPIVRMREQISRARKAGRLAYAAAGRY